MNQPASSAATVCKHQHEKGGNYKNDTLAAKRPVLLNGAEQSQPTYLAENESLKHERKTATRIAYKHPRCPEVYQGGTGDDRGAA